MGKRRIYTPRKPTARPTDAAEGAEHVRKFMIGLYDREDGKAADWTLIADTLFRAAFGALDEVPGHTRAETLLRRVHDGSYNRLVKNDAGDEAPAVRSFAQAAAEPAPPLPSRDHKP